MGRGIVCVHYQIENPAMVIEMASRTADEVQLELRQEGVQAWPKANMPVVIQAERRVLTTMRWGVWPWYKKTKPTSLPTNARDDSLLTKSIWKDAIAEGRCLIPADGFFEYAGPTGGKWEVRFRLKGNRPFFFAGLWTRDPVNDGRGFTMVTCAPNALLQGIDHDRMPLILPEQSALDWIGDKPLPEGRLAEFCVPYDPSEMTREDMPRREPPAQLGLPV